MSRPGEAVRRLAAVALVQVRFDGTSLKAALAGVLPGIADPRDRALCEAMMVEACRWLPRYEALLGRLLERPLGSRQRVIHGLLLVGLAQLDALGLPAHAAIDSTAEAARGLRQPAMVGLVNAVLRRFLRERDTLAAALQQDEAARYAHPAWLIAAIRRDWPDDWQRILDENNRRAPLWLRVNARLGSAAEYLPRLQEAGIPAHGFDRLPQALCLPEPAVPTGLPGWEQGWVSVQDGAAQAVAGLLEPGAGMRVLDACAAPGGKTAALLEGWPDLAVTALEISPERMQRLRGSLRRLGLDAQLLVADATEPAGWWDGQPFDRILLDVPCSASGVIRRQPDIKWHRRAADLAALQGQQTRLLEAAWPLLRAGGRLVYGTCSVFRDENEAAIEAFLGKHDDATAADLPDWLGRAAGHGRQRLPGEMGMDGFFYAALVKRG